MLVLTRKTGAKIHITTPQGDLIVVSVESIAGNAARLGVTAPRTIKIHREEVSKEIAVNGDLDTATRLERKATKLEAFAREAMEKAALAKAQAEAAKLAQESAA